MSECLSLTKTDLTPDFAETARYLGYSKILQPQADVMALIQKACSQMQDAITPGAVFDIFDLSEDFQNSLNSADLNRNLKGCKKVAILAATLGPKADLLIKKYALTDVAFAAILQAAGAMFIEEVVELTCGRIGQIAAETNCTTKPRFSPGYGDLSLETQKIIFNLLPCSKIGLTLMDTLVMAPEKSVTAFVGIKSEN